MDTFVEQIIARRRPWTSWIVMIAALVVALVVWALAFLALGFHTFMILPGALIGCAVSWGAYKLILLQDVEFEYSITNGDVDIDRIVGKSRRARVVSVAGKKIELLRPVRDGNIPDWPHDRLVMAAPSVAEATLAFGYYGKKNGRTLVLLMPDERVLAALRAAVPRTVADEADAEG